MKARLQALAARFDALTRRERGLVAAAVYAVLAALFYVIGIGPALDVAQAEAKRGEEARSELVKVTADAGALRQQADPDAENRLALEQARAQLAAGDAKLRATEASMVPPDKMAAFLESLLAKHQRVELVGLKTLPASPVLASPAAQLVAPAVEALGSNIYKHGVEIKIAGRYEDLLAYLTELEGMPQRILWNKITLTVDAYPRSTMTLTVYTLSLDKQWLTV